MAQTASQRSSSLHRQAKSTPGYFEFNPSIQSDTALIQSAMDSSHVHRLDAFHNRASEHFNLPQDAHIYAARPLPPVPSLALRQPSSSKSLRSLAVSQRNRRPSLGAQGRTTTTDCVERQLPPLPLRAAPTHRRGLSIESVSSDKPSESDVPVRRPRAMRSISFRNFLNRNTYPQQPSPTESVRTGSSLSQNSDSTRTSRDSRHDSIVDEMGITASKVNAPAPASGNRRPSTLTLNTLRARKISQENVPSLPVRPSSARKSSHSVTSGRRWGIFGADKGVSEVTIDDCENTPPAPITPPGTSEMKCHRCYYYSMRNCNGWVMGGSHGDACENCTMHGFFGSP
ncbi:hypothetical protein K461DRAFT_270526 [Myriangium duriaei CBS 260.36]|uniref:Uncharacterized protein n=1 Tax=Myriangium duriaei CBS 260.36 TaxID=1168546 RepID=A0A9P4IWR7_9PEZI|nr:hypothetical protein K461DRAFT_270526 [Myriangium duriaei CBS 260.36]